MESEKAKLVKGLASASAEKPVSLGPEPRPSMARPSMVSRSMPPASVSSTERLTQFTDATNARIDQQRQEMMKMMDLLQGQVAEMAKSGQKMISEQNKKLDKFMASKGNRSASDEPRTSGRQPESSADRGRPQLKTGRWGKASSRDIPRT